MPLRVNAILSQLKKHAPFTVVGTLSGGFIMLLMQSGHVSHENSERLFWILHPAHVVLSALVTAAMYRMHAPRKFLRTLIIGYVGAVGIATLSDSVIPFVGEWLIGLPNRGVHIGFIEKWWLVNPLALLGIGIAWFWPNTRFPHAGHVFLSTWASLFHITMALESEMTPWVVIASTAFLFLAVWIPCCTSDIVFPMLFARGKVIEEQAGLAHAPSADG